MRHHNRACAVRNPLLHIFGIRAKSFRIYLAEHGCGIAVQNWRNRRVPRRSRHNHLFPSACTRRKNRRMQGRGAIAHTKCVFGPHKSPILFFELVELCISLILIIQDIIDVLLLQIAHILPRITHRSSNSSGASVNSQIRHFAAPLNGPLSLYNISQYSAIRS